MALLDGAKLNRRGVNSPSPMTVNARHIQCTPNPLLIVLTVKDVAIIDRPSVMKHYEVHRKGRL